MAGVKRFTFHAIRHLTASWLDAHNIPLPTRHKSATTTARYQPELRGVQADLDSVFSDGKQGKVLDMKKNPHRYYR
jgi:integrase